MIFIIIIIIIGRLTIRRLRLTEDYCQIVASPPRPFVNVTPPPAGQHYTQVKLVIIAIIVYVVNFNIVIIVIIVIIAIIVNIVVIIITSRPSLHIIMFTIAMTCHHLISQSE